VRRVQVNLDDLEMIQSFLECGDIHEAKKILDAVLKEVKH